MSRATAGIIRIIHWCSPGHLRSSSLIHRLTLCCRFRCCWSHCLMNLVLLVRTGLPLVDNILVLRSAAPLTPASTSRLQQVLVVDIASLDGCIPSVKVRTGCIGVEHNLTTPTAKPEECQNQWTDYTQKGSPHKLCSLTANTEVCTPPVLPIAVCVAMRNVCCEELHWLFLPVSGTVSRIVSRFVAVARTVLSDLGSDPAYATHHYLVLAASVDSDLLDKIVNPRSTRICNVVAAETVVTFAASCTGHHRDQRCRRVHLHWCGLLFLTAVRTVTITSIISSEASRLSFVCSPPGQCTPAPQTRTSRFDIIDTSCAALHILEHLLHCSFLRLTFPCTASDSNSPSSMALALYPMYDFALHPSLKMNLYSLRLITLGLSGDTCTSRR